jgi:DNA-binding response OmpR family regulator
MRKLLVIDDHDDIRENIAEILTLAGYKTTTAPNGKKGVEAALKDRPDLVICDIMMPELDGYGVLHLMRKNESTANVPFIFLTARTERADFRKGMEMGADDYITKPFDDVELLNAIEIRLKKYDLLQTKYPEGEKGASEMINDLTQSGLLHLDPDNYEAEDLSKKQSLYLEGRRPKYLYYLKKGKIKGYRVHEDGKEYITNLYIPGDYIGYLPLLENAVYGDSAEALEDSELALIPRDEFLSAVYNDIQIATRFIRLIAQNVQEKEERLLSLAYGSLRKRIAAALVDIGSKFNKDAKPNNSLDISREDIAQYVGTATESLIRTLSDFKTEKLIEIKDGKIRITDLAKLKNLLF